MIAFPLRLSLLVVGWPLALAALLLSPIPCVPLPPPRAAAALVGRGLGVLRAPLPGPVGGLGGLALRTRPGGPVGGGEGGPEQETSGHLQRSSRLPREEGGEKPNLSASLLASNIELAGLRVALRYCEVGIGITGTRGQRCIAAPS